MILSKKFKPDFYNYGVKITNDVEIEPDSCAFLHWCLPTHLFREWMPRVFSRSATSNFGQSSMSFKRIYLIPPQQEKTLVTSLMFISPRANLNDPVNFEWDQIDVERTAGIGSTSRLYLYNETNKSSPPKSTIQGYHICWIMTS